MAISRMISLKALCLGMKLSGLSANVAIFDAYDKNSSYDKRRMIGRWNKRESQSQSNGKDQKKYAEVEFNSCPGIIIV